MTHKPKRKRTVREYSADLLQGGLVVASVRGSLAAVRREICHYAMIYLYNGPVVIRYNGAAKRERKE